MPKLTHEQISTMARSGSGNNEIEAFLGRLMNTDEKAAMLRGRAQRKMALAAKRQKAKSGADRKAGSISDRNGMVRRECENWERRKRLERNPEKWMKHYLAEAFYRPFEKPHKDIIKGVMKAHKSGGRFMVAAERGVGKSVLLWSLTLYLSLSGKQDFPVCVPWATRDLKRAFKFWKTALCFNELLAADYPEYCQPFAESRGIAQRTPNMWWLDTGEHAGAELTVGEGLITLPGEFGCLGGSTVNGNIRGLNHPQKGGGMLRPSIVLIDDVQDRKVAKSEKQVQDTVQVIDGDVAACGQVGKDLPMLMACNCIAAHDVKAHYIEDSNWNSMRIPCVKEWPEGFDEPDSKLLELWDEWHRRFLNEDGDIAYYQKHKKAMTKGLKLSAPKSFKNSGLPDAYYAVIRMYYMMGHDAFMAERQQDPVDPVEEAGLYTLTIDMVEQQLDKRKKLETPDWVTRILASTDINPAYALSSIVIGFGEDQTAAVLWYGLHKMYLSASMPKGEFDKRLFEELTKHGHALSGLPVKVESWAQDAGGAQYDPVVRFAGESARLCGIPSHGFRGQSSKQYKPWTKNVVKSQIKEQCHGNVDRKQGRVIRWVHWNADYWKEMMQRAWLGDVGSPGSISMYVGKHTEFAGQVCNEKLIDKKEIGGRMHWEWHKTPGRNDFGDALAQGFALAAYEGIGTSGRVKVAGRKRYTQADLRR